MRLAWTQCYMKLTVKLSVTFNHQGLLVGLMIFCTMCVHHVYSVFTFILFIFVSSLKNFHKPAWTKPITFHAHFCILFLVRLNFSEPPASCGSRDQTENTALALQGWNILLDVFVFVCTRGDGVSIETWSLSVSSFTATALTLRCSKSSRIVLLFRVSVRIHPALLIRWSESRASCSSLRSRREDSRWYLMACVCLSYHCTFLPLHHLNLFQPRPFIPPYLEFRMWALNCIRGCYY